MTKWRPLRAMLTVFASMAFLLTAGCTKPTVDQAFDGERAFKDLQAQVDFGYRIPGTKPHLATRDWLVAQFTPLAAKVTLQPFSHKLAGRDVPMWNVIADFTGTGAEPREQVVLAAHWDSRPTADNDAIPARRTQPIAGANDGASGVAILLEIARQLKAHPIARDVQIVLFDGEDFGSYPNMRTNLDFMLLGSQYYADHLPAKKPSWGILLDMVGDTDLDIFREPNSEKTAKAVNDRVFAAATALGYLKSAKQPGFVDCPYKYAIIDDHIAINKAGVPMADLIDFNYIYWHTSYDTPERCSAKSLEMVGRTVLVAIQQ